MKGFAKFIFGFISGAVVSYVATKRYYETGWEEHTPDPDESAEKSDKSDVPSDEEDGPTHTKEDVEKFENTPVEYHDYSTTASDVTYADGTKATETDVIIITPDEFGSDPEYDTVSWEYYAGNAVLTDERGDRVDDFPIDVSMHFGEYEEDVVYCRNYRLKLDYEIIRIEEFYQ